MTNERAAIITAFQEATAAATTDDQRIEIALEYRRALRRMDEGQPHINNYDRARRRKLP